MLLDRCCGSSFLTTRLRACPAWTLLRINWPVIGSQSSTVHKTWSFYKPACFITEKNLLPRGCELSRFLCKHLHRLNQNFYRAWSNTPSFSLRLAWFIHWYWLYTVHANVWLPTVTMGDVSNRLPGNMARARFNAFFFLCTVQWESVTKNMNRNESNSHRFFTNSVYDSSLNFLFFGLTLSAFLSLSTSWHPNLPWGCQ